MRNHEWEAVFDELFGLANQGMPAEDLAKVIRWFAKAVNTFGETDSSRSREVWDHLTRMALEEYFSRAVESGSYSPLDGDKPEGEDDELEEEYKAACDLVAELEKLGEGKPEDKGKPKDDESKDKEKRWAKIKCQISSALCSACNAEVPAEKIAEFLMECAGGYSAMDSDDGFMHTGAIRDELVKKVIAYMAKDPEYTKDFLTDIEKALGIYDGRNLPKSPEVEADEDDQSLEEKDDEDEDPIDPDSYDDENEDDEEPEEDESEDEDPEDEDPIDPVVVFENIINDYGTEFEGQPIKRVVYSHKRLTPDKFHSVAAWVDTPCPMSLKVECTYQITDEGDFSADEWIALVEYKGRSFRSVKNTFDELVRDYNETFNALVK